VEYADFQGHTLRLTREHPAPPPAHRDQLPDDSEIGAGGNKQGLDRHL